MCILFIYNGASDVTSDYSFILISNRDEIYQRPAKNMAPWKEDTNVIGGRDLETGSESGTWLAVAPSRNKLGVLLNLPRPAKNNAISRGKVVEDYVRSKLSVKEYVECFKNSADKYNDFIFVAVEFSDLIPSIYTYNNSNNALTQHAAECLGFGNSLPEVPLKKVEAGKNKLQKVCSKYNKIGMKDELINQLLLLLKSDEKHLPDPELEMRRPNAYQHLSSIFVSIPEKGYGTRTHTLILLTKTGEMSIIESTLQSPIDMNNPKWVKTEFNFNIK